MIFTVTSEGWLTMGARKARCALGPEGVIAPGLKREGDGATPLGEYPLRGVLYRPDRGGPPATALPCRALSEHDAWCDAPEDPAYNRPVTLPYPASAERLWREDDVYDLIVVIGHNDDPPRAGLGSAIFMHIARDGYPPTQGCVALARTDLEALLAMAQPGDVLAILRT
jgi:L,D-peptidoglycan transpeptidase YkuD (ErfK/YbiS/YcfS/YnhG family)